MGKAESSKARVTNVGLTLASVYGLNALTIGMVADRAEMSKSGIFALFGSRNALQVEILKAAAVVAEPHVFGPGNGLVGLRRLREFFAAWVGWPERAGLPGGCPFLAASFEFDDLPGPARDVLIVIQSAFIARVTAMVDEARTSGELRADIDVHQLVWEIQAIYAGHHVGHHLMHEPDARRRADEAFSALINRSGPVPASQPNQRKLKVAT